MATREDDIRTGEGLSMLRLQSQLGYSIQLASSELEGLKTKGWTDERQQALVASATTLGTTVSEHEGKKASIPSATRDVLDAALRAKAWKRSTMAWAENAFEDDPEQLDEFRPGKTLRRSAPSIRTWMDKAIPLVREHASVLSAEGSPSDWADQGEAIKLLLASEHGEQQLDIANLPTATADAYVTKTRVYKLLKKLNRIGRILHEGDAESAARYNMDLLNASNPHKRKPV